MTNNPGFLPRGHCERNVLFVSFDDMCLLDVTGPQTVFWAASEMMKKRGLPGYDCHTVSVGGGLVRTAEGVALQTRPVSDLEGREIDTVMVPGSFTIERVIPQSNELVEWLRRVTGAARRVTSVCTGAFLLAQAGLLHGKRVATHWMMCDLLQQQFPGLTVDRDAIFIHEGSVWTSAGVTTCIDLSLALVEADCGRDVAMQVALELVVYLKRPGGQPQLSQLLQSQARDREDFDELHLWIVNNLASEDMTVEMLAERVCMSPRTFARVYKSRMGRTPAKAVEIFRLEAARRMLEDSKYSVDQITKQCGFGNEERMRTTFLRNLSVTPRDYRQRFSAPVP